MTETIDKKFDDSSKLTSKEIKALQELSNNTDKLDKIDITILKNLEKGLENLKYSTKDKIYEVKGGDTLGKIANENGMSLTEIEGKNPKITDINKIYIGQKINLGQEGLSKENKDLVDKIIGKIDAILHTRQATTQVQAKVPNAQVINPDTNISDVPVVEVKPVKEKAQEVKKDTEQSETAEHNEEQFESVKDYFKDKVEIKVSGESFFIDKTKENYLISNGYIDKYGDIQKEESLKNFMNENPNNFMTSEEVVVDLQKKTGIIILSKNIDNYVSVIKDVKEGKTLPIKSTDMPDSNFEDGIFKSETFDKNLLNVINNKISNLTVKTDTGDKNIADIIGGQTITFQNGNISLSNVSKLQKGAKQLLDKNISDVLKKYNIPSKETEISFTIDKGGLFSSDSLSAIDAEGKNTDNLFNLIKTEATVTIDNGTIKGLDEKKLQDDKIYKLKVDGKNEEVMTGKALKHFIDSNKFEPGKETKDKLDVDEYKLAAEELGLGGYIKYLKDSINVGLDDIDKVGEGKYTFNLDGSNDLTLQKDGDNLTYTTDKGGLNVTGTEGFIIEDLKQINELVQNMKKGEDKIKEYITPDKVNKSISKDIEDVLNSIKDTETTDELIKLNKELEDAINGKGENVKKLNIERKKEKNEETKKDLVGESIDKNNFDKKFIDDLNDKISDIKIKTDNGDKNIDDFIGGQTIIFQNGNISLSNVSKLQKEALSEIDGAIKEIAGKYGIDSSKLEIDFNNEGEATNIPGDSLNHLNTKSLSLNEGVLSGITKQYVENDKIYKVEIDDKEKYLTGETLLDFIEDGKVGFKEIKKENNEKDGTNKDLLKKYDSPDNDKQDTSGTSKKYNDMVNSITV